MVYAGLFYRYNYKRTRVKPSAVSGVLAYLGRLIGQNLRRNASERDDNVRNVFRRFSRAIDCRVYSLDSFTAFNKTDIPWNSQTVGKLAKLPVLHTLDKIFGGLWSVGITYLIAVCLLLTVIEIVILKWIPDFQPTLAQLAQDSHIFKLLHNTNVIGSYLADLFGVDLAMTVPAV